MTTVLRYVCLVTALALLTVALLACGRAPVDRSQVWAGTSTTGGVEQPLEVTVRQTPGGVWTGTYTIGSSPPFTGEIDAVLAGQTLTGTLTATRDCAYALDGSISDDTLAASFTPDACAGASAGTWDAERQR